MRLIKLISILCCIVLIIGLCSFSVSAEIAGTESLDDGWYKFSYADFLNLIINDNNYTIDNVSIPYSYSTAWIGAYDLNFLLCEFVLNSDRVVNVPNKHTLQVETDFVYQKTHTSSYLTDVLDLTDYGFTFDVIESTSYKRFKGTYKKIPTLSQYEGQFDFMYTASVQVENASGSDYNFGSFGYLLDSGFVVDNSYRLTVSEIRFRVLDESQSNVNTITNGWTANPKRPAGSDVADQQQQLENQINQNTEVGREESSNLMNGFAGHISQFSGGFALFLGMFNRMIPIGWLNAMVSISLALGLFMLVFNLVPSLVDRSSAAAARRNAPTLTIRIRGGKK